MQPLNKDAIRRMIREKNAIDALEIRRTDYRKFGTKYPKVTHIAELAEREPRYEKIIMRIHELERFYIVKPVPLIVRHNFRNHIDHILELVNDDEPELIEICVDLMDEYGAN